MMKCHEIMGFMPSALASDILEFAYTADKALYRSVLAAAAEARKVRLVFYERKPRAQRHSDMLTLLSSSRLDSSAGLLLQGWLTKSQTALLTDFLNTLGISHKDGIVDQFPPTVDDGKLKEAVELLLSKYPKGNVAVYLHAVFALNDVHWSNLDALLEKDPRLQF
jgi:hypothetical protein